jgi:hypothetical protein
MHAMPTRLSLLVVLLLSALMLVAGAAHGAPPLPSLHMLAVEEEEPLEAEVEEEDETEEEGEEGEEESEGEVSAPRGPQGDRNAVGHRPHPHKKACRKPAARKRHCKHRDRQDGGFNSRARGVR